MQNEDCLAHYGVKGMKWGVRKSKSRIKSLRTAMSKRASSLKTNSSKKKEIRALASDVGMSKSMRKFNEIRKTTLTSHDAATIAKGMQTLTDKELQAKINRLKLESQVRDIATANAKALHDTEIRKAGLKKANNEAMASSIPAKILTTSATNVLTDAGKKIANETISRLSAEEKEK